MKNLCDFITHLQRSPSHSLKHVKKKGSTGDLSGAAAEIPPNPTSVTSPTTPSTPKTNNGSAPSLWPITADVDDGAVGSTENVEVVRTYSRCRLDLEIRGSL